MSLAPRLLAALAAALPAVGWAGGSVVSSKHDLSVSGPGPVRAVSETQVCVFCHVGHGNGPLGQNRPESRALYTPYQSSTAKAQGGFGPTGASRLCLSCHDGTIALGETLASGTIALWGTDAQGHLREGPSNLGTDLRRTHPVSVVPPVGAQLRAPLPGDAVALDRGQQVQCTSCHDPHREDLDPQRGKFLVKGNRSSALCLSCHAPAGWLTGPAAHQSSPAPARGRGPYLTVAESGCEACHAPHAAGTQGRLLRQEASQPDEALCLGCHDGSVARTDVASAVRRPSSHLVTAPGERVHDAAEGPDEARFRLPERQAGAPRHATCVDCHAPHAAFSQEARAPRVKGANAGVWGIDAWGAKVEPAAFEYQICFKCHGDSANQPAGGAVPRVGVPRRAGDDNLRLRFAPDAPSAHPVTQPGRSPDVPSLLPPYTASSFVYCTDCHTSDRSGAGEKEPRGPHGSTHAFLLGRNLSTADGTLESREAYALCYQCHDREVLLSPASAFPQHRAHVVAQATPCTACHTSHGVSPLQGSPESGAHLMDFDVSIVQPGKAGRREYRRLGPRRGTCTVSCHGTAHEDTRY